MSKNNVEKKSKNSSVLLGAAFIMATSAIGPGFLVQTAPVCCAACSRMTMSP